MATTMASRTAAPSSRRSPPSAPSASSSPPSGTKLRSTASPRTSSALNSSVSRRQSLKATTPSHINSNGEIRETRESLSSALKLETEKTEQLLVQLQYKDQTISSLTSETTNLSSALGAAETRLNELYADQGRMEDEMAARIEVSEKLRDQVRELEKEKRDLQRRYNEQTSTFEAERQAFYDNEQHLKSRIQSFTQAQKTADMTSPVIEEYEAEQDDDDDQRHHGVPQSPKQEPNDPQTEPAEMTSLRLELSTLSTSYASLQSTLVLLQTQLADLKRVNRELQEENESYMILLREKTLSGQFDISKQVAGTRSSSEDAYEDHGDDDTDADESVDVGSLRSFGRSTLDRVDETPEDSFEQELERLHARDADSTSSSGLSRHHPRQGRKRGASDSPRGESLAGLPITGPGLDLAAELGRAENKDIMDGNTFDSPDRPTGEKARKSKRDAKKPFSEVAQILEPSASSNDIEALRTEVKALKDANKALSLYASKIIDRIIAQEGFEHVLAIDYQAQTSPTTPPTAVPHPQKSPVKVPKARPQSVMVGHSSSNPMESFRFGASSQTVVTKPPAPAPAPPLKANRRSLSFDWKAFSFGGSDKKVENPSLRPLTLKPGSTALTGARKLDTVEDENDRRERERLNATMKLMGINKPLVSPVVTSFPMQKSLSSPAAPSPGSIPTATQSRFSWFRSRTTTTNSDTSSVHSANSTSRFGMDAPTSLTTEALAQAEAEENLASLDAHERALSAEIARGANSGFTEISRLGDFRSRRSKKSGGSGSTVWSAGMGKGDEEPNAT